MINEILGKIAITPKGQYVAGSYERLDLVTDNGSSYLSLKDNNVSYLTVKSDWMVVAEKGKAFEYSDFTPEQIAILKGGKGDPFIYSDFTPEQIAELQQPAADAIASIQEVELAVELAEGLRVQAEQSRQTNTATAIQNAETATINAGNAASLANEKAGLANDAAALATEVATHPDTIIADYWHKWNTVTNAYETTGIKAKGEQGIQGEIGQQGIQGIQGERGIQGEQGIQGISGIYNSEVVASPTTGTLTLKYCTETVLETTLTNANVFTVALPTPISEKVNESILIFKIGATLPTITQPIGIVWRGTVPTLAINKTCIIDYEQVNTTGTTFEIQAIGKIY